MTDSVAKSVYQVMSDVLNVPIDQINEATSPATVEGWDSVQHLNLVLALEQVTGSPFEPEEVEQMQSAGEIVKLVGTKLKP